MNNNHLENEEVHLRDILKRGVAVADANILFVAFYFAVGYLVWLAFDRAGALLFGAGGNEVPDLWPRITYILVFWIVQSSVPAFLDCIIARLLRKQVLGIQPDAGLLLGASLRKFYLRMLLLNATHVVVFTFALPLYPGVYVVLRYVTALVIWRDCTVRTAFSGLGRFLSVHLDKFAPIWLVGTVVSVGTHFATRSPASANPTFMGLLHLVVAYVDLAVVATAVVSFTMLERKQQEVHA